MARDAAPGAEAVSSQPMWLHWVSSDPMVKASSAWQGCPEVLCHGRSGEVVTVQWPRRVDADDIRARWVQVQWRFSPFAGWPPPGRQQAPLRFADREADIDDVAIALGVVSSRSELWEAQAQVVHYCTRREADAATCWQTVAGLDPAETTWRAREGIADFVVQAELEVPIHAVTAAARVMRGAFSSATLDGLGYVVAGMASLETGPDLEECVIRCTGNPDPLCVLRCCAGS